MTRWPHNARCAVAIQVLFNDGVDATALAPDLPQRSKSFSVWQYGALRGVDRMLQAMTTWQLPSTWFVPGSIATRHAALLQQLTAQHHEVAAHGWEYEWHDQLSADQHHDLLVRGRTVLSDVSNQTVTGFRLPRGMWPRHFDQTLRAAGYTYSATLNGDDVPYTHTSGLVEIPVHSELDDRPYFQFNFTPAFPNGHSRLPSYRGVLTNWQWEFDAYYNYGGCYVLQLHPEWTGTPGRIQLVHDILRHITQRPDVWVATSRDIAAWHAQHAEALPSEHPIRVYEAYRQERGMN